MKKITTTDEISQALGDMIFSNENQAIFQLIDLIPCIIFWKNTEGVYLGGNKAMLNMAGVTDLIGKTDSNLPWRKSQNKIKETDQQAISLGIPIEVQENLTMADSNKSLLLTKKIPIKNKAGNIIGLMGIANNITDTHNVHRLQQQLITEKSKNKKLQSSKDANETTMKNIMAEMPGHVYWKDVNGIYLGCNNRQAQSLGFKAGSDIIGKTDFDLPWDTHIAKKFRENDLRIMANGTTEIVEESSIMGGKESIVLSQKTPITDDNNVVIGILGISIDISDRKILEESIKKAKESAEAANHAKTEFIANMSHDIRTPLTGVVGMSHILEDSVTDANQKEYAHMLGQSGDQLLHMLNGILDVISADNVNDADLHEEAFDVRRMIQDILELEHPTTLVKGLELITHVDERIPNCLISDHTKIHRILLNLLGNAIKFTAKGRVEIDVTVLEKQDKHVTLQFKVSDTGIGIPYELQDKVFDRFFRVTPSYKGLYTGHGVGLHIAQSYAHLLGGNIKLSSEPNVGTSFYFNLTLKIGNETLLAPELIQRTPKTAASSSSFIESSADKDAPVITKTSNKNAPTLLLVEDNAIALKMLECLVSQMGFNFISTMDGESALKLATAQTFDLIITDLGLPALSGKEFARKLRIFEAEHLRTNVPIIGLTAHADDGVRQPCLDAGMNQLLSKPITMNDMLNIKATYFTSQINTEDLPPTPIPTNQAVTNLGVDLPNTEDELFQLDSFPLLNTSRALTDLGNNTALLNSILKSMIESELPKDLAEIKQAYDAADWESVERIAHRMKGGLVYCGTSKLVHACQYLERYRKAGHMKYLDALYQQMRKVADETVKAINHWLSV